MVAKKYQNPSGGLNEAGRKYFKRTTGANLKRPSKKVGNKRRASFCARMKGMKRKLTSAKTARDPNSRINKSLRAWNCYCLLYTSPSPRDGLLSRMPSSA